MELSDSERDIDVQADNQQQPVIGDRGPSSDDENEFVQENITETAIEQSVRNHLVAVAIVAGTFVLPCFMAAKLLK